MLVAWNSLLKHQSSSGMLCFSSLLSANWCLGVHPSGGKINLIWRVINWDCREDEGEQSIPFLQLPPLCADWCAVWHSHAGWRFPSPGLSEPFRFVLTSLMPAHIGVDLLGHLCAVILLSMLLHCAGRHWLRLPHGILHIWKHRVPPFSVSCPSAAHTKPLLSFLRRGYDKQATPALDGVLVARLPLIFCSFCHSGVWLCSVRSLFQFIRYLHFLYERDHFPFCILCLIGTYITFPDVIKIWRRHI